MSLGNLVIRAGLHECTIAVMNNLRFEGLVAFIFQKKPNSADQFNKEQQGPYETREKGNKDDVEAINEYNSTYPKMKNELEKRRSIAKVRTPHICLKYVLYKENVVYKENAIFFHAITKDDAFTYGSAQIQY